MRGAFLALLVVGVLALAVSLFLFENPFILSGLSTEEQILIYVQLEPEYARVATGSQFFLGVTLIKLGDTNRKDVLVTLFLKEVNGKNLPLSSQTAAIETRASLILALKVPDSLQTNSYQIYLEVTDVKTGELLASASQRILVFDNFSIKFNDKSAYVLVVLVFVMVVTLLYSLYHHFTFHHTRLSHATLIGRNRSLRRK